MKLGRSAKAPNIAKPVNTAVAFVRKTVRSASIRMSIIGSGTRSSTITQATNISPDAVNSAITPGDPQPQSGPSVSASSSVTRIPESNSTPATSTRDGVLIGDSGTKRHTSTTAVPTATAPT